MTSDAAEGALPSLVFSTDDLPAKERFDAWRDAIAPVFDVEPADRHAPRDCRAELSAFHLGDMLVGRISLSGVNHRGIRSARKIRRDPLDHYVVEIYTGGGCVGEAGGDFALTPGSVGIMDLGQPAAVQSALSESISVTIPRDLLDRRVADAARLHGTVLRGATGGLLGDYILSLHRHLPRLAAQEAARVSHATLEMIAACLAPSADNMAQARGPADAVLLERAKRYIARNLTSSDLSVGQICAALRVSRSHLYRAFEREGGVAAYIQARRLASIHAALRDPADRRHISELAYDHGFASPAHFSRAFRQHFGLAPSEVRELARTQGQPGPTRPGDDRAVESWLRQLGAATD